MTESNLLKIGMAQISPVWLNKELTRTKIREYPERAGEDAERIHSGRANERQRFSGRYTLPGNTIDGKNGRLIGQGSFNPSSWPGSRDPL